MSQLFAMLWLREMLAGESEAVHQANEALVQELTGGLEAHWPSVFPTSRQARIGLRQDEGATIMTIAVEATEHLASSNQDIVTDEFVSRVQDLALACHIAYPGSLWVNNATYYLDDVDLTGVVDVHPEPLWMAIDDSSTRQLNPLRHVTLANTWRWFCGIPEIELYYSDHQLWRAVNYLRYALYHDDSGEGSEYLRIVWVMMGLEALYGDEGYSRQPAAERIGDKILTFVKSLSDVDQVGFHRLMGDLYKARNKLFHGALSMPRFRVLGFETSAFDQFFDRMSPITNLGLAFLVATLQELALRGWSKLSFTEHTLYFPRGDTQVGAD